MFNNTCTASIDEVQQINYIAYPNPFEQTIQIEGIEKESLVQIISLQGLIIKEFTYQPGQDIDFNQIENGVYFFRINGASTLRIVKK